MEVFRLWGIEIVVECDQNLCANFFELMNFRLVVSDNGRQSEHSLKKTSHERTIKGAEKSHYRQFTAEQF